MKFICHLYLRKKKKEKNNDLIENVSFFSFFIAYRGCPKIVQKLNKI
jgi:hypothetical protein